MNPVSSHRRNGQRRRRRRRSNKHQQEIVASHFDKSRIEKELDLFFGCDDEDADDHLAPHKKSPPPKNASSTSTSTSSNVQRLLMPPLSSYSRYGRSYVAGRSTVNQDMDPFFNLNPPPGRCDTDDFNFLSIMEEDQQNEEQEEVRANQGKPREEDDLKQIKTRSLTISSSSDGDQQEGSQQQTQQEQQQMQQTLPSNEQGIETSPLTKQYPESDIDGFSVIEQMPIPERKMLISYSPQQLKDRPPELLTISMDCNSMAPSLKSASTGSKSHLSYDESLAITSSISFFLNANKEELSIAGGSISPRSIRNNNNNFKQSYDLSEDESQTARGHSRGSSKFTTDSPRILELREKKRLMERSHERKYNKFPALIEVDKFST